MAWSSKAQWRQPKEEPGNSMPFPWVRKFILVTTLCMAVEITEKLLAVGDPKESPWEKTLR